MARQLYMRFKIPGEFAQAQRHGKGTLAVKEGQTCSNLLEQLLMYD